MEADIELSGLQGRIGMFRLSDDEMLSLSLRSGCAHYLPGQWRGDDVDKVGTECNGLPYGGPIFGELSRLKV